MCEELYNKHYITISIIEFLNETGYYYSPLLKLGLPDHFQYEGDYEYILEKAGLTVDQIVERIKDEL